MKKNNFSPQFFSRNISSLNLFFDKFISVNRLKRTKLSPTTVQNSLNTISDKHYAYNKHKIIYFLWNYLF